MTILKQVDFEVPNFGELAQPPTLVPRYQDAVLAMDPLAYWRLGETSGATLADEAGTYPLTLTGNHTLGQDGAIANDDDGALYFFGGRANAAAPILPSTTNAPFSIAFWAKLPAGPISGGAMMAQYTSATTGHTRLHIPSTGLLRLTIINQVDFYSNATVSTDWQLVVLTRSASGTLRWFVDGQLDAELVGVNTTIAPINFLIGNPFTSQIVMFLDEVAIFDDELTESQVRWLNGLGQAQLALPPDMGANP